MNEAMAKLERDLAVDPSDWGKIERLYALHERLGIRYRGRSLRQLVQALKGKNPVKTRASIRSAGIVALPELVKGLSASEPRLVTHAIEHIGELKGQGIAALSALEKTWARSETMIHRALLSSSLLLGPEARELAEKSLRRELELLEESVVNEMTYLDFLFEERTGDPMRVQEEFIRRSLQDQGAEILDNLMRYAVDYRVELGAFLPQFLGMKERLQLKGTILFPRLSELIDKLEDK